MLYRKTKEIKGREGSRDQQNVLGFVSVIIASCVGLELPIPVTDICVSKNIRLVS